MGAVLQPRTPVPPHWPPLFEYPNVHLIEALDQPAKGLAVPGFRRLRQKAKRCCRDVQGWRVEVLLETRLLEANFTGGRRWEREWKAPERSVLKGREHRKPARRDRQHFWCEALSFSQDEGGKAGRKNFHRMRP